MSALQRPDHYSSSDHSHLDLIAQDAHRSRTIATRIHNESVIRDARRRKRRESVARFAIPFAIITTTIVALVTIAS